MTTNNVTRFLDSKKIKYQAFDLPAEKLGAIESARLLGVPARQVFKTIVVIRNRPGKPILAVVPGDSEVDLKSLAAAVGEKKLQVSTQAEAEKMTGLLTGGISPLALINKGFQVWVDQSARDFDEIHISGGQRGLNIRLPVDALVLLTGARMAVISSPGERN
ncbi:MAG: Cys-tRNA(Pro) deacylase [Leptolinea sp.]|jgi:Cys-tRNA(Pro)/Cys-tRNA(Cys) deacylase|nr:Cys-tRNA(Pro) deacylase [Leptolinea sp.]